MFSFFLTSPSAKPKLEHNLRVSAIPLRLSHCWMRCAYFFSRTAYPLVRISQWIVVIITVTESSKQWSDGDGIEQELCIYVYVILRYKCIARWSVSIFWSKLGMPFTYQNGVGRLSQYTTSYRRTNELLQATRIIMFGIFAFFGEEKVPKLRNSCLSVAKRGKFVVIVLMSHDFKTFSRVHGFPLTGCLFHC